MTTEVPARKKPRPNLLEAIALLIVLGMVFRATAAVVLILLVLLRLLFPLHGSRRAITVAYVLFCVTLLVPVDIQVPGFHSSVDGSKHSGPRFVPVLHGLVMRVENREESGEFISGGCVVGVNPTQWMLVWD